MANNRIQIQAFLASLPLFRELEPADLDPIAAATTVLNVVRGEIIFNRGDPCAGFHLVVYGQIKLAFISAEGIEKVVEIVPPGFSFGEAPMFLQTPYVMMAQALADSMLLHVTRAAVFAEIDRDTRFTAKLLAAMSQRVHRLVCDVEAYSLQSGTERFIGYLLQHDVEQAERADRYVVTLPTSKAIVASRLNVTAEHFSRILHDLIRAGLITVAGRDVTILDRPRLKDYHG